METLNESAASCADMGKTDGAARALQHEEDELMASPDADCHRPSAYEAMGPPVTPTNSNRGAAELPGKAKGAHDYKLFCSGTPLKNLDRRVNEQINFTDRLNSSMRRQVDEGDNAKSPSVASSFVGGFLRPLDRGQHLQESLVKRQEMVEQLNRMNQRLHLLQTPGRQMVYNQVQRTRAAQALLQFSKHEEGGQPLDQQDVHGEKSHQKCQNQRSQGNVTSYAEQNTDSNDPGCLKAVPRDKLI